ncbi:TonB-dependent receptor [Sphingobacterium hotanense]|uniref:TonB-dependent receptor n=1 Tax=Sphingobacterium hotanense TaxID=649196 RepID=A0ABT7NKV7_9SPHI|nr:TonB-dependent receptor [Sphingobacterium hotanense]MDM1047891.1 TonB-dependent receptor [Sphingobacterium hotanense]
MDNILSIQRCSHRWHTLFKIILVMKLTILILVFCSLNVLSKGLAQTVTLHLSNNTLEKAISSIKKQTGYRFIYQEELLNNTKMVSLNLKDAPLKFVLDKLLEGQALTYSLHEGTVVLKRAIAKKTEIALDETTQRVLSGMIQAQGGEGLASVTVRNLTNGSTTSSDESGAFHLDNVSINDELQFSLLGYKSIKITVKDFGRKNITLVVAEQEVEEVVVVGYGTQKKVNLTGAVDVVGKEELANRPAANISMLIQGAAPNTNISLNSLGGEPGASQKWQIRGVGSISGNTTPLILVDGVESNVNLVDPETVESISILKDASASAVYGSRAAFGVVLITTKKGAKNQPTRIEYSNNLSATVPIYVPNMESSLVYATAFNQAATNAGITPTFGQEQLERIKGYIDGTYLTEYDPAKPPYNLWRGRWDGNANYNWTREYYKKSFLQQKHNVNLSGGSEKNQFYISSGFFDQPGAATWGNDGYKRYNILANVNSQVADWLSFNFSSRYGRSNNNLPLGMVGLERTYTWSQFINFWPTMPMYNIDGSISNPLVLVLDKGGRILTEDHDLWLNLGAEIEPLKGWKTSFSYKYNYRWGSNTQNPLPVSVPIPNGATGNIGEAASGYRSALHQGQYNLLSMFTSYERNIGSHYLKGLVGYEEDVDKSKGLYGFKRNLITDQVPSISTATGDFTLDDAMDHWATQGVFGRINYNFDEKYLFEASARYDGSSRFAPGKRWGFFPSFSAGYNISKEHFWEPIKRYLNTFKLRGSYGALGNQNVANYLYLPTIPIQYRRITDNSTNPGYIIGNEIPLYANAPRLLSPDLTWEKITTLNLGAEVSLLNSRLDLVFDWYNRITSDMLGPTAQLPATLGASLPQSNNAKLSTKGYELTLAWNDRISEQVSYNLKANFADNKTKILEYYNQAGLVHNWYAGKEYGEVWGLTTDRIMQSADENMPDQSFYHSRWGAGDIIYKDLDGNGKIDEGDRTLNNHGDLSIIANTAPRYFYSLSAGINWKGFDFNMFWQGIGKRDFLPNTTSEYFWGIMAAPNTSGVFKGGKMLDYWRPADETNMFGPNTNSYFPKPYFSAERAKNIRDQSRYVLNASYIRLKNLQIGYSIPKNILDRVFVSRARIYFSAENLLTFSTLPKLYEPETAVASNPRDGGVDMGEIYPINQMYSFGINLTF